ncbi:prefoldin subunit alpha [archaeon]|nr:prefoldin subunit alpha [archaeon]
MTDCEGNSGDMMTDEKKAADPEVTARQEAESDILSIRFVEGQLDAMQKQVLYLEDVAAALASTRNSLNDLKKLEKDTPSLLPVGTGVFVNGVVKKQDFALVDIGAGVVVEKTIGETLEMVRKRDEEVQRQLSESQRAFMELQNEHRKIAARLDKELPQLRKPASQ